MGAIPIGMSPWLLKKEKRKKKKVKAFKLHFLIWFLFLFSLLIINNFTKISITFKNRTNNCLISFYFILLPILLLLFLDKFYWASFRFEVNIYLPITNLTFHTYFLYFKLKEKWIESNKWKDEGKYLKIFKLMVTRYI